MRGLQWSLFLGISCVLTAAEPQRPAAGSHTSAPQDNRRPQGQLTDRAGDPLPRGALLRLGTTRLRTPFVQQLSFSPDGRKLASLNGVVWEVPSGKLLGEFTSPCNYIADVRFSAQGHLLAVGGDEHTVWLWDVLARKKLRRLKDFVPATDFSTYGWLYLSPDGNKLAIAVDGLAFWDVVSGKCLHHATLRGARLSTAAFSADGKLLATGHWLEGGSPDVPVRIWDTASGKEVRQLKRVQTNIRRLAFTPDGKGIVVACEDETNRLLDVATCREVRRFDCLVGEVDGLAVSPNGKTLAAGPRRKYAAD